MTATFSTTGFSNIRVTYARRVASYGSGNFLFAEWSPDGSKVVFEWYEQGWDHNELRAANLDGSGMQTLWVGGPTQTAELPDWGQ